MVRITIDGRELEAEEDETVLQVAKRNNIEIPTLCHHPAIPPYSACRVCTVEVDQGGRTKLTASCSLPVSEGMVVKTRSDRVLSARKVLMELYLARCPDSSELREFAASLGVGETRFESYREVDDRCILCGLCVNVCADCGNNTLGFMNRGVKRKVGTPFEKPSDHCLTCGACTFVCPTGCLDLKDISSREPIPITRDFDEGLAGRGAIDIPFPQAIPNVPMIDREVCNHFVNESCRFCEKVCEPGALRHDSEDREMDLEVGSVIMSPGFEEYVPPDGGSYGYNIYPNVLTSIQFERMLSASGPYKGHVKRISDGREPRKIAWLQCVGSRDESCNNPYCSSVCCMYSIKEAVIAKEHVPGLDTHLYYMDMRSFGKDFDKYYDRAKEEHGVVFRRSRVPRVDQDRETKDLTVRFVDDKGRVRKENYDMVVLSVGLRPCDSLGDLAGALEVNLNGYGFVECDTYSPTSTSREGIYASGTVTEPKDIPESVTQASAAAADAAKDITEARGSEITLKEYPTERSIMNDLPSVGVFICHCGINIGGVIDVKKVVEMAGRLPYVDHADDETFTCSSDSLDRIKDKIRDLGLNRIVVASCTPRTHEPIFQDTLKEAGLNPHLFEMVNIRDQNSWVHRNEPKKATKKAMETVRMGVAKVIEMVPVQHHKVPVIPEAMVIGGGIAGMSSSLSLADQGFKVHLIEREAELGGSVKDIYLGTIGEDPQKLLGEVSEKVMGNPLIDVHTGSVLEELSGYVGNFTSKIMKEGSSEVVQHGVIVVATGSEAYEPTEYSYGRSDHIIRQKEFEKDLAEKKAYLKELKEVVMIQCVGSRNDEHPYCSRVCCTNALKNSIHLKELNPEVPVYILYRDIRSYGFREDRLYKKARELGVIFVQFDEGEEPDVKVKKDKITVLAFDKVLGKEIRFHPDRLVLSTGMVPRDNSDIAQKLKVPLNSDGFFSEAHMKLRPVDFSGDGIFLAGCAHSPRFIEEAVLQGKATGARAATILSKEFLETKGNVARISSRKCAGCRLCIEVCPYDAIDYDEEKKMASVNEILCQGCGACAAVCPSGTTEQASFTKKQIISMIDASLR
ncbi:MAG: FAD-dependent oxidoreductase [Thermoplasmatota archaeon]